MKEDDCGFRLMLFALGAALVGVGGWGLAHLLRAIHAHFLTPTYQFTLTYFASYGRGTAELVCGVLVLGLGLRFHHKTVTELTQSFTSYGQGLDAKRTELEAKLALQTV